MNIPSKLRTDANGIKAVIEVQNEIIDCLHDIEARLPKPEAPKRWRAEEDDIYWCVLDGGMITFYIETRTEGDTFRYNIGNYFKTEAEAQAYREALLAKGMEVCEK